MFRVTVNGTDRRTDLASGVSVTKNHNERWTARVTFALEYVPVERDEIVIYEIDGTTPMFGGLVHNVGAVQQNNEGNLLCTVECVDWWAYLDWILVNGGYGTATVSLEQVLTDLVTLYLSAYGITLSGSQATGPTGASPGLNWEYKWASEVIRDLTRLSGGWVAKISPAKVLEMVNPSLGSPSAPYALTDASSHCETFSWTSKSDKYANRVTLKCGGDKTKDVTQTKTLTSTDISNGYFDFFAPATPTGGVSGTLDTGGGPVAITIGGPGSNFIWTWNGGVDGRPRITPGTMGASAGDILVVSYTAQFPFFYQKDAGVTPYFDAYYEYEEITEADAADDMATGLLAMHYQTVKEFKFFSRDHGFEPGQVLTVNLTRFQINTTGLITAVELTIDSEGHWGYDISGITGVYQGSALDYLRSINGRGTAGGGSTFSGSINTSVVSTTVPLGGATHQSLTPASGTYERVINAVPFVAVADMTVVIRVELWARTGGVQVTARLQQLTPSAATAGTSSGVTSTTPQLTTFTASLVAGRRYELQITSNSTGAGIYGIGSLQSV